MVEAYVDAPKPKIQKVWCRSEEEALVALREKNIPLKDTALGVAATQMARAVVNNVAQLDPDSISALKAALEQAEQTENISP